MPVPVGAVPDFCCRLGTFGKLNILKKDGKIQNNSTHFNKNPAGKKLLSNKKQGRPNANGN